MGTQNILSVCKKYCPNAEILIACSSAEYGDFDVKDCPLNEEHNLRPITPYGVSKATSEMLGFQFFKNYGLKVILPRLFIHLGTGHPPATAVQNFARQLALIKKGKIEPLLKVGNLETSRDFIDVRDGIDGMCAMIENRIYGTPINVCTGKAHSIKEILNILIEISRCNVKVESDNDLFRLSDELVLVGNNTKLRSLGWQQNYLIYDTLETIFNDWEKRV